MTRSLIPHFQQCFPRLTFQEPRDAGDCVIDCFGGRTRRHYLNFREDEARAHGLQDLLELFGPAPSEEYYDWVDLCESVSNARDRFTVLELGAGWGRWSVFGALAARSRGLSVGRLGAYEAEPTHFAWVEEHFRDNDLAPEDHDVRSICVGGSPGQIDFLIGNPRDSYGQSALTKKRSWRRRTLARLRGRAPSILVDIVALDEILAGFDFVDLLHMDVQGSELDIVEASMDGLGERVRKVHIGTHPPETVATRGRDVEPAIRAHFMGAGWQNLHDVAAGSEVEIEGVASRVNDGIQSWLNPRFARLG